MFQLDWAGQAQGPGETGVVPRPSAVDRDDVESVLQVNWEEHCVECAVPQCYSLCALYARRGDGACARFSYGIVPNPAYGGHYDFGADIQFKKWGKLEADLHRSFGGRLTDHPPACATPGFSAAYRDAPRFDAFVLECYSPEADAYKLLMAYFTEADGFRTTRFRHAFHIRPGYNFFTIPFEQFHLECLTGCLCLYPETSEPPKRIIFTWLDFVKYKPGRRAVVEKPDKIKCIAWDLDNTLWRGIASEEASVTPIAAAVGLVKQLDERGILQTIVSKNDFEPVWAKLGELGIQAYFLYPAINWGQKSRNLRAIAGQLNLSLDTFGVIDDSAFERAEIAAALPMVRVYSEQQIPQLLGYPEFDVPVTAAAQNRRRAYQLEADRARVQASFDGSYEAFLQSFRMVVEAYVPGNHPDEGLRCWELLQRTNQLNLSGKRYTREEFAGLLAGSSTLPVALRCADRFGDYGTVGYASLHFAPDGPVIEDFVLSCRVAQKRIEHAFFNALAALLAARGYEELQVRLVRSPKNEPLQQVLKDLPFEVIASKANVLLLSLPLREYTPEAPELMHFHFHESVLNRHVPVS